MAGWNHNQCWQCWVENQPTPIPGIIQIPVRIKNVDEAELDAVCCYCGHRNIEGIYRRANPVNVPCGGLHKDDE